MAVFSEIIQNYDTSLNGTEMIIMITRKSIYILDSRCNLKMRYELANLGDVILIKAHPSFFALCFLDNKPPLVLECFRRSELSIFALSLREHQEPKPRVITSDTIQMTTRSAGKLVLDFDKAKPKLLASRMENQSASGAKLFKAAILSGYMDRLVKGFFQKHNWPRTYVVLTSVGLIFFEGEDF